MDQFYQISEKKDHVNFISMVDFNKSIIWGKKNDQRQFSPFKNQLDLFYLSLLVGLKLNSKKQTEDYIYKEMTDNWTEALSINSYAKDYIIALYLNKLIDKVSDDKAKIKQVLNKSLDNKKRTSLSQEGMKEMHEYCFGGYEKILEACNNELPSSIVFFLMKIKKLLEKN